MNKTGIIYGINGPVIYLKGDSGFKISEMVYVGKDHLVGEVIGLKKGMTTIQVFEETTGLRPGETVIGTGDAISVLLGPGIIHNIFDGIQRPLEEIAKASGKYISRGVSVDSLDTEKKWNTHIIVKEGDVVVIPANVKHWHGAKKNSWFSHLALEVPGENTSNEWCEKVTDEEYNKMTE